MINAHLCENAVWYPYPAETCGHCQENSDVIQGTFETYTEYLDISIGKQRNLLRTFLQNTNIFTEQIIDVPTGYLKYWLSDTSYAIEIVYQQLKYTINWRDYCILLSSKLSTVEHILSDANVPLKYKTELLYHLNCLSDGSHTYDELVLTKEQRW